MRNILFVFSFLLLLTSCSSQSKIATQFQSIKSHFFSSPEEKQMKQVIANIREGNAEKAELEISLISSPFTRCNALAKLAHFQIIDQNDLIAAKKNDRKT